MYKISVSGHFGSVAARSKHCIIVISLGQAYHEGDIFSETLNKMTTNFNNVSILIADTLQRHNDIPTDKKLSDNELINHYHNLGNNWIERNLLSLQKCNIKPTSIYRWTDWLNHPAFISTLETIEKWYLNSAIFKEMIDQTINKHLQPLPNLFKGLISTKNSRMKYIFEECAILKLWEKTNFDYIAYPAKLNLPMQFILKGIHESNKILIPLYIRYKKIHPRTISNSNEITKRDLYYNLHSETLLNLINLVVNNSKLSKREKIQLMSTVLTECGNIKDKMEAGELLNLGVKSGIRI